MVTVKDFGSWPRACEYADSSELNTQKTVSGLVASYLISVSVHVKTKIDSLHICHLCVSKVASFVETCVRDYYTGEKTKLSSPFLSTGWEATTLTSAFREPHRRLLRLALLCSLRLAAARLRLQISCSHGPRCPPQEQIDSGKGAEATW
jgi:hypothetical protein